MGSPNPSRFPRGLNNQVIGDRLNLYGLPDPTRWITYFTDFAGPSDNLPDSTNANYTVTKTGAGVVSALDGSGGLNYLSNAAGSDDAIWIQRVGESFRWSASKKLMFAARFSLGDVLDSNIIFGLQITDTTPLDVTDGIFFQKLDGSAVATLQVEKDDAAVSANAATLVNATMVELAFVYEGTPFQSSTNVTTYPFKVYVNGAYVTTLNATTTVPNDEDLTVSFGLQNGTNASKNLTIDYILAALERG